MIILLINNFFYHKGGSETVFFNTGELLKLHGHTVYYFSQKREENIECQESVFFPPAMDGGNFFLRFFSYFYNLKAACCLEQFLNTHKIDIAHVHLFWGGLSPSILRVLKKHHIPVVHTAHDYRMVCPASTFLGQSCHICEKCAPFWYLPCLFHKCAKESILFSCVMMSEMYFRKIFFNVKKNLSGIIFVSSFSRYKHFQKDSSLQDVENICLYNFSNENSTDEVWKCRPSQYDLFIGRLSPEKGVADLIKAWKISKTDKELHIIGDGPQRGDLEKLAKELNASNILFEGFCDKKKITSFLHHAKYLIIPSICYENNPMTIIEAFAQGIPVIGMQIGGIPELIGQDRGFLISYPASAEDIASSIQKAHSISEMEYSVFQSNCIAFFQKFFSAKEHYHQLINFYEDIIKKENEAIC